MAVLIVAGIIFTLLFVRVYQKCTNAVCTSRKRLQGKTALITGGTTGMGLEIATEFARRGARVIVCCPFEEEGRTGLQTIIERSGSNNVVFELLDLSSFESTRKFAAGILENEQRLDILVNNAGVGGPLRAVTGDGLNFIMQVNYYGAFLLTLLLLPLLKKTGTPEEPSRIVNTSSIEHMLGKVTTDRSYSSLIIQRLAYCDSKICLVAFSQEFKKKTRGYSIVMNSVDPGFVGTNIFRSLYVKYIASILFFVSNFFFKTAWEGAQTALHVALDLKAGDVSGAFYKNCQLTKAIKSAYDETSAQELWEKSVQIVKLTDKELDLCFKS